jgi:hypothetical protein
MQCDSYRGCHDFKTIQERAEGLSTITKNSTGRGEPKHSKFCGGIFVCMCIVALFDVGRWVHEQINIAYLN